MIRKRVIYNDKFRLKLTNRCSLNCTFCHHEGTTDSADLQIDEEFKSLIVSLKKSFNRVHLTGGEPFLYTEIFAVVSILKQSGYSISITTNGLFNMNEAISKSISMLEYVNFSFHSLNPLYYSQVAKAPKNTPEIIMKNISLTQSMKPVRINAVVTYEAAEEQNLDELLAYSQNIGCELKLVPMLQTLANSSEIIDVLLSKHQYQLMETISIVPGSNVRLRYSKNGHIVEVKKLSPFYPQCMCQECEQRNQCKEGFSFLRVGGSPLYCQKCLNSAPVSCKDFLKNELSTILELLEEYST